MSRINTNVTSLFAINNLARSNDDLTTALRRLSSGLRINSAADDPSGLIVSEELRGEKAALAQAIDNSVRAGNIVATAEAALNEVSALLVSVKDLVVEAANSGALSDEEIEANQLAIDNAVSSITRIARTTRFAGRELLNGTLAFRTSGVDSSDLAKLSLYSVEFGGNANVQVTINVTASAQTAATVLLSATSSLAADVTFEFGGVLGAEVLSFASGAKASAVADAINNFTEGTGVSAVLNASGVKIDLYSTDYGSSAFVSVREIDGTLPGQGVDYDVGQDAGGTINGVTAVGDALSLTLKSTVLDVRVLLDTAFGIGTSTFYVTGGGAIFQLGSVVNPNGQVRLGIDSLTASNLGNNNDGYLSDIVTGGSKTLVEGKAADAAKVLDAVIMDVAGIRGRLGAFVSNVVDPTVNSLQVAYENVAAAESLIRDADFSAETASLTRAQVLVSAGSTILAIANASPQAALALLG